MRRCRHTSWIDVSRGPTLDSPGFDQADAGIRLADPGRLDRLVGTLPRPTSQIPQVVCFVGGSEKDEALRQIFPGKKCQTYHNRLADLYLWSASRNSAHPVLFANHDIHASIPTTSKARLCHQSKPLLTEWASKHQPNGSASGVDIILTRLLFPFCDVVYLFADDLGGLGNTLERIKGWLAETSPATTLAGQKPSLVVVTAEPASATSMMKEEVQFYFKLSQIEHSHRFASITIRRLSRAVGSDQIYRCMREELRSCHAGHDGYSEGARPDLLYALDRRRQTGCAFTAQCLAWLFRQAIQHVRASAVTPLDTMTALRVGKPHPSHYVDQIRAFLRLAVRHAFPMDDVTSMLAAAVIVDAYDVHCHEFSPEHVYPMYEPVICEALQRDYVTAILPANPQQQPQLARDLSRTISKTMCAWVERADRSIGWAMNLYVHTVRRVALSVPWPSIQSNLCCLSCVVRRPEHVLACGHSYCERCVMALGEPARGYDYAYTMRVCVLCSSPTELYVRVKPPTAGVRIMAIDGGGVRGIIPLSLLRHLQDVLGNSCQVRDFFDLVLGTSAGGLIALGMFCNKWDIDTSTDAFARLSMQTFPPAPCRTLVGSALSLVRCVMNDAAYSGEGLDMTLQEAYGSTHKLFGYPSDGIAQFKIGVTAADTDVASPVLLNNYNGDVSTQQILRYRCERSEEVQNELFIWQSARATSAAPFFFSPAISDSGQAYQDGGFAHQNPAPVAIMEAQRIWGEDVAYDVTLSLGTGIADAAPTKPSGSGHRFRGCALLRCFRWGIAHARRSLDGHLVHPWTRTLLPAYARADCHRLDVKVPGHLPRMDDARCMGALRTHVDACRDEALLLKIKLALIASCFYFELDGTPVYSHGRFACRGTIRLRMDYSTMVGVLKASDVGRVEFLQGTDTLVTSSVNDFGCPRCERLALPVKFFVRDLDESVVTISVRLGDHPPHRMSGFPHSVQWFVDRQGLSHPFAIRHVHSVCWCGRPDTRSVDTAVNAHRRSHRRRNRRKTRRRTRHRRSTRQTLPKTRMGWI